MLRKAVDLEISAGDPFQNDQLDRKQCAENLTRLIRTLEQPFVLSVNGAWGSGKTTFVKMWKRSMELDGQRCLYFNAWENDFVEDPLVPFIAEMEEALADHEAPEDARRWMGRLKSLGWGILRYGLPTGARLATLGALDQDAVRAIAGGLNLGEHVADAVEECVSDRVKDYLDRRKGITEFKEALAKFAEKVTTEEGVHRPVVFFVDELDRCRPDYAIALLERIKHLFSVPHVLFVLSVDRTQLAHSVRARYGADMDSDGYLRRFIDLEWSLPQPDHGSYGLHLLSQFGIDVQSHRVTGLDQIVDALSALSSAFDVSLRTIERCVSRLNVIIRSFGGRRTYGLYVAFLVVLREVRYDRYKELAAGSVSAGAFLESLGDRGGSAEWLRSHAWWRIKGFCICHLSDKAARDRYERQWNELVQDDSAEPHRREEADELLKQLRRFPPYEVSLLDELVKRVEMAARFG